jgi:hypothetical protein
MFTEGAGCVGDNVEFASFISLAKDGTKASLILFAASGSINNEGIRAILTGVIYNRFRAEGRT